MDNKNKISGDNGAQRSDERRYKNYKKGNGKFDNRKIQCYNSKKFGHFVVDCRSNNESKSEEANIVRGDLEDEHVLLTVT